MTPDERIANTIANDLVQHTKPVGVPIVIALEARAGALRDAILARWKTMLSAYSAGIAHADPDVDTTDQQDSLRELQKVSFVVVTDRTRLPATFNVAYATFPLDDAWRAALGPTGARLVDVAS